MKYEFQNQVIQIPKLHDRTCISFMFNKTKTYHSFKMCKNKKLERSAFSQQLFLKNGSHIRQLFQWRSFYTLQYITNI